MAENAGLIARLYGFAIRCFGKREQPLPSHLESLIESVPDNWMVYRLGQSPEFMLWNCVLFEWWHEGESGRVIKCNENDTAAGALRCCLSQLNGDKRVWNYDCGCSA